MKASRAGIIVSCRQIHVGRDHSQAPLEDRNIAKNYHFTINNFYVTVAARCLGGRMSISRTIPMTVAIWASCLVLVPAHAEPSTKTGAISVAQVAQMLDQAPTNRTAQQVLTAYLGGVGEAAGVVIDAGGATCQRPLTLATQEVRAAIAAATEGVQANQVAATPLIVRDMLARAGCRRR